MAHTNCPSGSIIVNSAGPLIANTSSASALAVNDMQRSIAQHSAKKNGSTFDFKTLWSFAFIGIQNLVSSFTTITRTTRILFQYIANETAANHGTRMRSDGLSSGLMPSLQLVQRRDAGRNFTQEFLDPRRIDLFLQVGGKLLRSFWK